MNLATARPEAHPLRPCSSADRLMWITADRVFYAGLLGQTRQHVRGSLAILVAVDGLLTVRVDDGPAQRTELAVIPPYTRCEVRCDARHVLALHIEPETVATAQLPTLLRDGRGAVDAPAFAAHIRACHTKLLAQGHDFDLRPDDFDPLFFGQPLPVRPLDARIASTLARLRQHPGEPLTAQDCASAVGLSFSRFLHLFKAEVGVPFRSLRAWRRARSLLHYVDRHANLAQLALDIGYPDSTHFSHSIRQSYGLRPSDIFAGSRKLRLVGEPLPAASFN